MEPVTLESFSSHLISIITYSCVIEQRKDNHINISSIASYIYAPIKIETCRYGLNRLPVEQRVCEECQVVEDECHVIMYCTLYTDIRDQLFIEICDITSHFQTLTPDDQFLMIMSDPQYYRCASRAMYNILNRRRCTMLQ